MATTYTSKYANGAAVDAALDKAGTALQAAHIDTDSATTALHHTLGTGANQAAAGNHAHSGVYEPADATILKQANIDNTPVDGVTTKPISSNWAFDHAALTIAHGISAFGATLVDDANAAAAQSTLGLGNSATKNVGTAAGTVAAGDDSRITGAATATNLTTETDNRILYDEDLTRAVTYAIDLAGQASRVLSGSVPSQVPASAAAPGRSGQVAFDASYIYICTASGAWKRAALSAW